MPDGCVVLTGASGGLGTAISLALAEQGFHVACASRRGTVPEQSATLDSRLRGFVCDVTEQTQVVEMVSAAADWGGGIAGVVNCAGVVAERPSAELPLADLRRVLEVNLVAAVAVSQAAYPYLRQGHGGLIVNIGSVADKIGMRHNLAYAASKAALGSITRTLANEWARDGIRVLDVAPGYVVTDINRDFFSDERNRTTIERRIPVRRLGQPEEIGALVASLFANSIGYLTGSTIYIDGGQGSAL